MNDRRTPPEGLATCTIVCEAQERPEVRTTDRGSIWLSLRCAYGERQLWGAKKGEVWARYLKVKAFGPKAKEVADAVQQGTILAVTGTPSANAWQGNEKPMADLEVSVESFAVLSGGATVHASPPRQQQKAPARSQIVEEEHDLPW